jgi:ADP-heptose:LPS heptosyltransferase
MFQVRSPGLVRRIEPLDWRYRKYEGQDLAGKSLLVWRTGGFGDLLFLTPLLAQLRADHDCVIHAATRPVFRMVLEGGLVDAVHPLPIAQSFLERHDYHLHFEGTVEVSRDPARHAVDLFARHAGVELRSKNLVYRLPPDAAVRAEAFVGGLGLPDDAPRIAVQARASSIIRTFPPDALAETLRLLVAEGIACLVLGREGHFPEAARVPGVIDLCGKLPMVDSVAVMTYCDALLAPDSSLTHFAGALGVPTVALYGPFPGAVRTAYYPRCTTLEAQAPCAPCFLHGSKPCPRAEPSGHSSCWRTLPPERIAGAVVRAIETLVPEVPR